MGHHVDPEGDQRWVLAFIARYPTAGALLAMDTDDDYRQAVKHGQAAVADSRVIRMSESEPGSGFSSKRISPLWCR